MSKVNWMARADHEFIPNYKILQAAFDRNNTNKYIDVDKLIRAKYQDNLEFLQWMKAMWDLEGQGRTDYDPVKAREGRPVMDWAKPKPPLKAGAARGEPAAEKENLSRNRDHATDQKFDPSARRRAAPTSGATAKAAAQRGSTPRSGAKPGQLSTSEVEELKLKNEDQAEELRELRETLDGLESERDYYFRKLRHVEILCTTHQAKMDQLGEGTGLDVPRIISDIQGILYAENDEEMDQNLDPTAEMPLEGPRLDEAPLDAAPELPSFRTEEGVPVA